MNLPLFTLKSYSALLEFFLSKGKIFCSPAGLVDGGRDRVFLRHDVDFSLELALPMAEVECQLGVRSTYYVLLSGPYNPCSAASINAMRQLRKFGHSIGLHYDLSLYPDSVDLALRWLDKEISFLQELSGGEVDTIVMHEPSRGHEDLFINVPCYINPSYYQKEDVDLLYVSDSCRAWRDLSLVEYLEGRVGETSLMLNTHPESWLANGSQHRLTYLENTLLPKVIEPTKRYFLERVGNAWRTHIGPVNGYGDLDG